MKFKDLTGEKFSHLAVIKRVADVGKNRYWLCECDCGTVKVIGGRHLSSGKTTSCGCYREHLKPNYKHGGRGNPLYSTWSNIINRCENENYKQYKNYGGRGISLCEEWRRSFKSFYDYMSKLPHFGEKGYSIDRINNNGDYEPSNVRWATKSQQAYNRRSSPRNRGADGRFCKTPSEEYPVLENYVPEE